MTALSAILLAFFAALGVGHLIARSLGPAR